MVATLTQLPWHHLFHAGVEADELPQVLCDLASSDSKTRQAAMSRLYASLWHDGAVYEAPSYVVPFLMDLLFDEQVEDKHRLLSFLGDLANADDWIAVSAAADASRFTLRQTERRERVRQTRLAVMDGISLYDELLRRDCEQVRAAAALLMGRFPEQAQAVSWRLSQAIKGEKSALVRDAIVSAMGQLRAERV